MKSKCAYGLMRLLLVGALSFFSHQSMAVPTNFDPKEFDIITDDGTGKGKFSGTWEQQLLGPPPVFKNVWTASVEQLDAPFKLGTIYLYFEFDPTQILYGGFTAPNGWIKSKTEEGNVDPSKAFLKVWFQATTTDFTLSQGQSVSGFEWTSDWKVQRPTEIIGYRVPEPSSLALFVLAGIILANMKRSQVGWAACLPTLLLGTQEEKNGVAITG